VVHGLLMFVFFCGFNALEASQPSLVSRMAPAPLRGAALGAYNTLQSLGLFAGGAWAVPWPNGRARPAFASTAVLCALAAGQLAAAPGGPRRAGTEPGAAPGSAASKTIAYRAYICMLSWLKCRKH
jgi:hypothetical protein